MFQEYFNEAQEITDTSILEMAYDRSTAVNRCADLGKPFIEHFKKAIDAGANDAGYIHHCAEMQAWFDDAKSIVLKPRSKHISNSQLIDWFFTRGSDVETLLGDKYEDVYNVFIIKLLDTGNIKASFDYIFNKGTKI